MEILANVRDTRKSSLILILNITLFILLQDLALADISSSNNSTQNRILLLKNNLSHFDVVQFNHFFKKCNFKSCLCSFHAKSKRYYLYCNDASMKSIPDFTWSNRSDLIFSKLDFSLSGVKNITATDFDSLKLDITEADMPLNLSQLQSDSFEEILDHLKSNMNPTYHIDLDNIEHIESGSFQQLIANSIKLASETIYSTKTDFLFLKIRFQNSRFDYQMYAEPFRGLIAKQVHFKNIANSYLHESLFTKSIISEILITDSPGFIGFVSNRDRVESLLHKLTILNR